MELERAAQAADPKTAALHRQLAELHLISAGDGQDLDETSNSLATTSGRASARG